MVEKRLILALCMGGMIIYEKIKQKKGKTI